MTRGGNQEGSKSEKVEAGLRSRTLRCQPEPCSSAMPPTKPLVVDASDVPHAVRNRVYLSAATMLELGLGIGDHVQITLLPASETRGRSRATGSTPSSSTESNAPTVAFGIAWPTASCPHYSTACSYPSLFLPFPRYSSSNPNSAYRNPSIKLITK